VVAVLDDRQAPVPAHLLDPQQVGDEPDLLLHVGQPDQVVQLGQQLLQRPGLGLGFGRHRRGRSRRGPGRGLGLRAGGLALLLARHPLHRVAVDLDRGQLGAGGHQVERRHHVADVGAEAGQPLAAVAAVPGVGRRQQVEQRRAAAQVGSATHQQLGAAQVGRGGPGQLGREPVPERGDQRPQLVVGVQPVGVDEGARQVVGLDLHVVAQLARVDPVDRGAEGLDRRRQVVHEGPDGLLEGVVLPGHCGSRHMGHSGGPSGRSIWPVTAKPKRW
jgi:hypothetical protein